MKENRAEDAAKAVERLVNIMGNRETVEFIELMNRMHRTLQQSFTGLCFMWIENCAKDDYRTDGRNQASHEISKEIIDLFKDYRNLHDGHIGEFDYKPSEELPFI